MELSICGKEEGKRIKFIMKMKHQETKNQR